MMSEKMDERIEKDILNDRPHDLLYCGYLLLRSENNPRPNFSESAKRIIVELKKQEQDEKVIELISFLASYVKE